MKVKTANIVEYRKKYTEKNKEKLYKKCICEVCGGSYSLVSKSGHMKTKNHIHIANKYKEYTDKINELEAKVEFLEFLTEGRQPLDEIKK